MPRSAVRYICRDARTIPAGSGVFHESVQPVILAPAKITATTAAKTTGSTRATTRKTHVSRFNNYIAWSGRSCRLKKPKQGPRAAWNHKGRPVRLKLLHNSAGHECKNWARRLGCLVRSSIWKYSVNCADSISHRHRSRVVLKDKRNCRNGINCIYELGPYSRHLANSVHQNPAQNS